MIKTVLFVSLKLLLFVSFCCAQTPARKDSLFILLKSAKDDTSKAKLFITIADQYENNNQDSCLYFLTQAKQLSQRLNFKNGLYSFYQNALIVYFTKGDYKKALLLSDTALSIARELNDSAKIVNITGNIGVISQYTGEFEKQLNYTLTALAIMERLNMKEKLASMYHNLANAYFNLNQMPRCIEYCQRSLDYHKTHGGEIYLNRVYSTIGQAFYKLQKNDSAIYYFKKAITESKIIGDKFAESSIYGYMVNAYADLGDFSSMRSAAENSLSISRQLQSEQLMASALYNSAFARYLNNDNAGARQDINQALTIATKDSLIDELKNIYTIISYIAAKDGDFVTSLKAAQKADSIKNSILNETVLKATAELEKRYETEKKDDQIKLQKVELQRKNLLNNLLFSSAAFLLLISVLSYRGYKQKQNLQQQRIIELETEKQLAATEAVLKGEEQERTRLAKDLHDGLGGMLSGIKYSLSTVKGNLIMTPENAQAFERSIDMLNSSIKEMRRVAHNMMPEALVKFGLDSALKDFCHEIQQSGALQVTYQSFGLNNMVIDQTTSITIYRIVQELLNNTIKHASATHAIVQVTKTDAVLAVTVEDDGKGFDTGLLKHSRGIGWDNIQHRVEFLKGRIDVNSQPGNGTSVNIEFAV